MARAKKCDRCGKLHEYYAGIKEFKNSEKSNGVILIDKDLDNKYWTRKSYDFCPDCMRKPQIIRKGLKNNPKRHLENNTNRIEK